MGGFEEMKLKLLVDQDIICREEKQEQGGGEQHGKEREEEGFGDELADEVGPAGAYDLEHAHFPGALFGSGSRQVHKIDTGDEQDGGGDEREEAHVPDGAARLHAVD